MPAAPAELAVAVLLVRGAAGRPPDADRGPSSGEPGRLRLMPAASGPVAAAAAVEVADASASERLMGGCVCQPAHSSSKGASSSSTSCDPGGHRGRRCGCRLSRASLTSITSACSRRPASTVGQPRRRGDGDAGTEGPGAVAPVRAGDNGTGAPPLPLPMPLPGTNSAAAEDKELLLAVAAPADATGPDADTDSCATITGPPPASSSP